MYEANESESKVPSKLYRQAAKEEDEAVHVELKALNTLKVFSSIEDFNSFIQERMLWRFTCEKGPKQHPGFKH